MLIEALIVKNDSSVHKTETWENVKFYEWVDIKSDRTKIWENVIIYDQVQLKSGS